MGEIRNVYETLVRKPEGNRPFERPMHIWKDDLKNIWCENVDWTELTQNRGQWWALVNMVMNLWVP
jgi:hypothetical protein